MYQKMSGHECMGVKERNDVSWMGNVLHEITCLKTDALLAVLCGKSVECLAGGASLEEVYHRSLTF